MQKTPRLNPGDTVAVVSPSSGLPSVFPHVYDEGVRQLQETFGLKVKVMPAHPGRYGQPVPAPAAPGR